MTCVVGLVERSGVVWMGGDTLGSNGHYIIQRRDPKVFRRGSYLIGYTSSFRMGNLLRYEGTLPEWSQNGYTLPEFMVREFVPVVRQLLKDSGYAEIVNNQEFGGTFLVAVAGELFEISNDFQVGQPSDAYAAIGGGREVALGAMFAAAGQSPRTRIEMALRASERFTAGVRRPFTILRLPAPKRGNHA